MLIPVNEVTEVSIQALIRAGASAENAKVQIRLWVEAELRGHPSHGLLRLPRIIERITNGVADPVTTGRSAWRGDAFLAVDGERGLGPVVAEKALTEISQKAKKTGVALAAINNSNHLGMLAIYAEDVARKGQVLIALTTSEALVHPWGGRKALLGTNPVAIGVPAEPHPFVLDMATGVVSMGKVHDYANRGKALEPGWALDGQGDPTLDASAAKNGAIAPFGQAKGYALGLAFEVLVASLTGTSMGTDIRGTLDSTQVCNKGDVFIVVEPAAQPGAVSAYLDLVRACEPSDPARPVLVPGDRAQRIRHASGIAGIKVDPDVWSRIQSLA